MPTEAFPLLASPKGDTFTNLSGPNTSDNIRTVRRRKSSGLGGEIRAGDTGVPALATWDIRPPSPGTLRVRPPPPSTKTRQMLISSRHKVKETERSLSRKDGKLETFFSNGRGMQ